MINSILNYLTNISRLAIDIRLDKYAERDSFAISGKAANPTYDLVDVTKYKFPKVQGISFLQKQQNNKNHYKFY